MFEYLTFHGSVPDSVPPAVPGARAELGPFREFADLHLAGHVALLCCFRYQAELVDTELLRHGIFPVHASHNYKQQQAPLFRGHSKMCTGNFYPLD